jgi:hypothetical protein
MIDQSHRQYHVLKSMSMKSIKGRHTKVDHVEVLLNRLNFRKYLSTREEEIYFREADSDYASVHQASVLKLHPGQNNHNIISYLYWVTILILTYRCPTYIFHGSSSVQALQPKFRMNSSSFSRVLHVLPIPSPLAYHLCRNNIGQRVILVKFLVQNVLSRLLLPRAHLSPTMADVGLSLWKLRGFSPRANYVDRSTAVCQWS